MWYHRKWALSKPEPRGMVRFTLAIIADHCNEEHECWISLDRLAAELGLIDTGTASRHCGKLAEAGIIEVSERWRDDGTQSSNLYRLNVTDREIEPFMDPQFDPYRQARPARLERRKKVRERQETARAIRQAMEEAGEPPADTPAEGYREASAKTRDPGNIAGVTPASMQGSPMQNCQGHPGSFAGGAPADLPGYEQSVDSSAEPPVDEPRDTSRATAPAGLRIAGDGRPSGLPAGHGAKAAPREREIHQGTIDELDALSLRLSAEEKQQREKTVIESAIYSLQRTRGIDGAATLITMTLDMLELADKQAHDDARAAAENAIRPPQWKNAERSARYAQELDVHAVVAALNRRPLREWPAAVLDPLGLAADGVAA